MRIGEFSKKHNTTIDTIRHYIDLELIIPEKIGSHYLFNNKCSADLEEIMYLKEMGFSLQEVQKIFALKRFSGLKTNEEKAYYRQILMDKKEGLIESKYKIDNMIQSIEGRLNEFEETKAEKVEINILGVPIEQLYILACPGCGKRLTLHHGEIQDNMVIRGELNCKCGEKIAIDEGIIIVDRNILKNTEPVDDWSKREYVEKTPHEFVNFMYMAIEWIVKKLDDLNLKDGVIMEIGIGSGLFLSHFENKMNEETLYIGVDFNLEYIKSTKKYCEVNSQHKNYMFICCEMMDIPIKREKVDIIIDYLGTTNYNFKNPRFLIDLLNSKLNDDGLWIGSFFYFKEYCKTLQRIGEDYVPYLRLDNIIRSFGINNFKILDRKNIGFVDKSGVFENFLIEGDRVYQEVIVAKKE